jgi:hypothetical protein
MKRFLLSALIVLFAAEASGQVARSQTSGKPSRKMASGAWRIVSTIGLDTDLFAHPIALASSGNRFVVVDEDAIHSFTTTGKQEWRFGRTGSGPGEFRQILSVAMDSSGNTLVYDDALARLSIIDAAGRLRRETQLTARTDRAVFSNGARYLLLNTASDTLSRVVDSSGVVGPIHALPVDLGRFTGITREMSSIVPIQAGFMVTFRWSSRMMIVSPTGSVIRNCTGLDSLSFPDVVTRQFNAKVEGVKVLRSTRVDPSARAAVFRAALVGDQLLIEPSISSSRSHVLDVYSQPCGKYVESRPFPYPVIQMAGTRTMLIAMMSEPVPHVLILRWASQP